MSAVGSRGCGHQPRVPMSLECFGAHGTQKALQHPLFCVGVFCLVKMLKNVLCLIGIYVFLSCVGQDTLGSFDIELNQ